MATPSPGPFRRIVQPPRADRTTFALQGSRPADADQRFRSAPHHDRVKLIDRGAVSLDGGYLDHDAYEPNRPLAKVFPSWRVAADAAPA
jgi:hypothetical protein